MDELLQHLEINIKTFLQQYAYLRTQNQSLLHNQTILSQEKTQLSDKNQKTISMIETMIQRLKTIEKNL
jgi:uncharacterized protein (TIGR02449 family)